MSLQLVQVIDAWSFAHGIFGTRLSRQQSLTFTEQQF
jgi:hypothetical protein